MKPTEQQIAAATTEFLTICKSRGYKRAVAEMERRYTGDLADVWKAVQTEGEGKLHVPGVNAASAQEVDPSAASAAERFGPLYDNTN